MEDLKNDCGKCGTKENKENKQQIKAELDKISVVDGVRLK